MIFLYLLLLAASSCALEYTIPSSFGGKTDFSDQAWRKLIEHLSPELTLGQAPSAELNIATEPSCAEVYLKCSTTYFGKQLTLRKPDSAMLWVKWHQDASPFACDNPNGCVITSSKAVADLTSQSDGWSVKASVNPVRGTNNVKPAANNKASSLLNFQYSDKQITTETLSSTRTLSSKCSPNHMCYIQTGTLMMTVSGKCDSKPVIVCDRHHFPCEEYSDTGLKICSQWDTFTQKYCQPVHKWHVEKCFVNVAVTSENGVPMSFQVFEQKPISGKESLAKRDFVTVDNEFGELPDGSSGAWLAWSH